MRVAIAVTALGLLLGGCQQEPDFDERFDKAQEETSRLAKDIDRQIDETAPPETAPATQVTGAKGRAAN
ncbi:hypothetical protein [Croceicoccus mobilis]|uniref:Uncharacterized protein n=1 Tax=Croceicoccus mobilis TaxID=1703339 RepID=A0A916Z7V4_9SPHN|nr:hypothetical protein [Croceicoccus mobilis]GGD81060.1 hypothetical protein GCM10010990_33740 [Croceicoccus mobilis]